MTRLGSLPAQRAQAQLGPPFVDSSCCQICCGGSTPVRQFPAKPLSDSPMVPISRDPLLRTILQWPPDGNPRRDTLTPSAELQVYPPRTVARGSGGSRSAVANSNEFITRGEGSSSLASQDTAWRARLCVPPEKAGAALVGSGSRAHKTLQTSCVLRAKVQIANRESCNC